MAFRVDPHSEVPPSRQIVEVFLDGMSRGTLEAGDRLPSVRTLAEDALVNPNTVGKAYRDLEMLGAVEGRNGSGVFVTAEGPAIARGERRRSTILAFRRAARAALRAGHEAETLQEALAILSRAARAAQTATHDAAGGEDR